MSRRMPKHMFSRQCQLFTRPSQPLPWLFHITQLQTTVQSEMAYPIHGQSISYVGQENASSATMNTHNEKICQLNLTEALHRGKQYRAKWRKASFWAFYREVSSNIFACVFCAHAFDNETTILQRDRKYRKGLIQYKTAVGANSLCRHVTSHHKNIMSRYEECLQDEIGVSAPLRQKQRKVTNTALFNTHSKYEFDSVKQKHHDEDLNLLVAKACLPLSIIENNYFKRYFNGRHSRVRLPARRQLTDKLIPNCPWNGWYGPGAPSRPPYDPV